MKKLIFMMIFICITEISLAEAPVEEVKQNSKIGITVGYVKDVESGFSRMDYSYDFAKVDWEASEGISGNIFFNHPVHKKFFVSLNLGYNSFKKQTQKTYLRDTNNMIRDTILNKKDPDNIVATFGVNWWCYSDKIYIGMGGGALLHKRGNDYGETKSEFYFTAGFSYPIPKYHISIEANTKLSVNNLFGINIGLAYLIP